MKTVELPRPLADLTRLVTGSGGFFEDFDCAMPDELNYQDLLDDPDK